MALKFQCKSCNSQHEFADGTTPVDRGSCPICGRTLVNATIVAEPVPKEEESVETAADPAEGISRCHCVAPQASELEPGSCALCGGIVQRIEGGPAPSVDLIDSPALAVIRFANGRVLRPQNPVMLCRNATERGVDPGIIRLDDSGVSGKHVWLSVTGSCVQMIDLASRNGVWVNGERLEPVQRHDFDVAYSELKVFLGPDCSFTISMERPA